MGNDKKEDIKGLKSKFKKHKKLIILLSIVLIIILALQIPAVRKKALRFFSLEDKTTTSQKKVDYNSKHKLNLVSAYGDKEAYHPKILQFDEKWNGYYYWMSYTPYPDSDEQKENPHIVASNDLVNWVVPEGLINPLDDVEGDNKKQYNSDSHLVYNKDLNRLECYWRYVDDEKNTCTIYRKNTTDGVNWTEKEVAAFSDNRKKKDYVAPAVIYEDGKYKIWYVDHDLVIWYAEAQTNENKWTDIKKIELKYPKKLQPWHLDIIKTDKGYEMLLMAFENWEKRGIASLYHTVSTDNENWSTCKEIVKPTTNTKHWDNRGIYRSSMIKKDGIYYVFYSASNTDNIKGIGIMYGKDINNLKSVNINYSKDEKAAEKFNELIEKEKSK